MITVRPSIIKRIAILAVLLCFGSESGFAQTPTATPVVSRTASADPNQRQETFELVWQTVNKSFYDPKFNGVDWKAIHDRYAPRVSQVTSDAQLYFLLQLMVNELHQSHFWIIPPEAVPKLRAKRRIRQGNETSDEPEEDESQPETALDLVREDLADRLSTGIGIELRVVDGLVIVTRVDAGSPAARAGLRPGFVIRSVDGMPMALALAELESNPVWREIIRPEIPLVLTARYLNGSVQDSVQISYTDARNLPRRVQIAREQLNGEMSLPIGNLPSLHTEFESKRLAGGVGYIRFNAFVPAVMKKICGALRDMHDAPGMILDLRGNEGGLLGMIGGLSGLLQDYVSVFGAMKTRTGTTPVLVTPQRAPYLRPLVILIDGSTQSAAEMFAAGMQQTGRAIIVGDISAGATLPSAVIKLPTGGLFQYALGTYETDDGKLLEGRGVVPDWIVKINRRNLLRSGDPQLAAALVKLRERMSAPLTNEIVVNVTGTTPDGDSKIPKVITVTQPPPPPVKAPSGAAPPAVAEKKAGEDARIAQQVVNRYIDAVGGEAALLKVTSRVATGTIELPFGLSGEIEVYEAAPNRSSVTMDLKGFGVLQDISNGKIHWLQDPVRGYIKISDQEPNVDSFHRELQLRRSLNNLRFERTEKVAGRDCFVIDRSVGVSVIERLYFSIETGLLVRENDMYYEDYREVDGVRIPFVVRHEGTLGAATVIRLKDVKQNLPVDETKFTEREDCFTRPDKKWSVEK